MSDRAETSWAARSRNETLFASLYDCHHRAIRAFCRRRVEKDAVDDVVAETFLVAWRRIDVVPTGEAGKLWLYGVAYRVISNQWRGAARRRRLQDRLQVIDGGGADNNDDDTAVAADQRRLVVEAAARLNDKDAEVLRLAAWEQLSMIDIAEVLGIAPNAVKQRLHRAKQHLGREYRALESRSISPTPDAPKGGVR